MNKLMVIITIVFFILLIGSIVLINYANRNLEPVVKSKEIVTLTTDTPVLIDTTFETSNSEKYEWLMDIDMIEIENESLDDVIAYINNVFDDNLIEINRCTVNSVQDNFYLVDLKSVDDSILVICVNNEDLCISYESEKKERLDGQSN